MAVTGYHRNAVMALLWEAVGWISAKRLRPFVPELLDRLTGRSELRLRPATTAPRREASTATLERLLAAGRRSRPRRA